QRFTSVLPALSRIQNSSRPQPHLRHLHPNNSMLVMLKVILCFRVLHPGQLSAYSKQFSSLHGRAMILLVWNTKWVLWPGGEFKGDFTLVGFENRYTGEVQPKTSPGRPANTKTLLLQNTRLCLAHFIRADPKKETIVAVPMVKSVALEPGCENSAPITKTSHVSAIHVVSPPSVFPPADPRAHEKKN
ncbi:hypothetical protein B0H16DRAFT_1823395, partial [Mycena metata]